MMKIKTNVKNVKKEIVNFMIFEIKLILIHFKNGISNKFEFKN